MITLEPGRSCADLLMRAFPRELILLAGVALTPALFAQARWEREEAVLRGLTDFHHTAWGGLGAVFDIKQSSEGYLWLTTSKGILRFDGVRFQSLQEVTRGAVFDGDIDSVFLSASGGLWLTTEGAGLLLWKDGRLSNFPDRRCTPSRKQGQIIEDQDGSLWVQATAGLFRLRGSVCEQIGPDQGYPGGFLAAIFLDRAGTLWVKTQTGPLLSLQRGASKFQRTEYGEGTSAAFAFLHEAPDGMIWLSDTQGLRRVTGRPGAPAYSSPRKTSPKSAPFGDFTFAADGSLWAVTKRGVRRFDHLERWPLPVALETAPGESFTPETGLSSDAVWKVLIDREGVWIATNSGLDRLRSTSLIAVRLPVTQEHEFSIAAGNEGSIWTGNSTLPLTHIMADGTIASIPGTRQTIALRRDHNGTIWSAGAGDAHLWRSSGDRFLPLHYPDEELDSVLFVAVDRNNEPWITTSSGRAYHLTGGSWRNQTETLGKKPGVRGAMVDDKDGNVWFAFSNKVVMWDGSTYHWYSFPDGQRGVSENTMSVRGDHVWLGGAGGVQLFTQGKFFIMRWKDPGLPGRVSGLVETETGDLWSNGFSGITHVSAAELNLWLRDPQYAVSAERLDELDGLPGLSGEVLPEPSLVEAPDGKLWFATTKGIAWLDPDAFEKNRNRVAPPVIISAVISDGRTYSGSDGLSLSSPTDKLEIEYTALSLAIPERVLFRYKLDGVDEDWQNVSIRRQAYYNNLRPGNYRFRVIACNNDGVWNETGAVLNFRIMPAFYQALWFQWLCVLAGAGALWFLHRLRLRQTARQLNMRMEERVNERTRIARDLHDTILQSFQGVLLKFHAATFMLPDRPMDAKGTIETAIQQARQAIAEGRDAVQGLRSSTLVTNGRSAWSVKNSFPVRSARILPIFVSGWKVSREIWFRSSGTKSTGLHAGPFATHSSMRTLRASKWKFDMINGSFACGFGMMEEASMRKFWVKLDRLDISGCLV
ncbi:MAG: triple tyrosine motif-containing protein [Bryobacteraceae bacterium]|jgi:ligand-binding sensor domain-containing protein